MIDPLAEIIPPGVGAGAWQEAVRETHAMLVSVMSANLLDVQQMQLLRDELKQTVERRGSILKRLATSSPASGPPWPTAPGSCSKKERPDGARATPDPRSCLPGRSKKKVPSRNFLPPHENRAEPSPGSETG